MARMRAADAAVAIMQREGVKHAFGVPGAAINPLYAAMKRNGSIEHVLARHVEGASHMAEGYTRARAGNSREVDIAAFRVIHRPGFEGRSEMRLSIQPAS